MPPLIDCHLHLQDARYQGQQEQVMARARGAGVKRMLCNTTSEQDWPGVLQLAGRYLEILPFLGIHPWEAQKANRHWDTRLAELLTKGRAGVGEIGLDRACGVGFTRQQEIFVRQLELACELERPVSIHCIRAWGRLLELLQERKQQLPRFMVHSFSGSVEVMGRLLALGGWISFGPGLARQERLAACCRTLPRERLLLETDSPDQLHSALWPNMKEGALNEPARLPALYQLAASIRDEDLADLTQQVWDNGTLFADSLLPRS